MPATLYATFGSGNSFKPALLLRQTGKVCVTKFLNVLAGESRQPGFLAINPRGQVPFLVLEDGRGIGESNAIAWWVAEGTPLMPADAVSRAQAVQWMIFEQTSLEPNISPARFFTHIVPEQREAHDRHPALAGRRPPGLGGAGQLPEPARLHHRPRLQRGRRGRLRLHPLGR